MVSLNFIGSVIFILISTSIFSQSRKIRLEEGTILYAKSLSEISSKTAQSGDLVDFVTTEPVVINKDTLIAQGAKIFFHN